jgi:hypothetical protein
MNVNKKTSLFRVAEGYLIRRDGRKCRWHARGRGLTFEDYCGIPIDSEGAPLDGEFVEEEEKTEDAVHRV